MKHFYQTIGEDWFTYPNLYKSQVDKARDNSHFVEVGSWKGRSASFMGVEIWNSGKRIKFDCVDTWEGSVEHKEFDVVKDKRLYDTFLENIAPVKAVINPIKNNSLEASKNYPDNSLDFVFIDASHEYQDVVNDINAWYPKVKIGGTIAGHDVLRDEVVRAAKDTLKDNFTIDEGCWIYEKKEERQGLKPLAVSSMHETRASEPTKIKKNITIVTGLWDLGRGDIEGWAKRDFSHYKDKFFELLKCDVQMCIWIPDFLKDEVEEARGDKPTKIFVKNNCDFKEWNPFFDKIQQIRNNPSWRNYAGWLAESPQATLEYYNPMMFTKMFMLNDSAIINPFSSEYLFWMDGGLTNTVHSGYFLHDMVLNNLDRYVLKNNDKFIFISYPYESNDEVHGFERKAMAKYCDVDFVRYVCRGGFFGGPRDKIHDLNDLYYGVVKSTLDDGLMGADECLFTILAHRHPNLTHRFEIAGDGLVWPFFENLKEFTEERMKGDASFSDPDNSAVYVLTFNSPAQFEALLQSMEAYDGDFISRPKRKYLLDNSSDLSTTERYKSICEKYGYEHIKKDNLGICGGRQFIAEHAEENGFDFYMFFEDDMFFYTGQDPYCKNGFRRKIPNLYKNSIAITRENGFDFLKLSFTEFYGDNGTQWAWYNVPQDVREKYFPEKISLPVIGTDPDAPRTKFNRIRVSGGIPYADGEIYYCNWPQVVSRQGNKKMFLTERWGHPYEGTWMSYIFQETKKGNIRPGLLLASPTQHERRDFYDGKLRKES